DRGPLPDHPARRGRTDVRIEVDAAVGERVRSYVEHAHHRRPREPLFDRDHVPILARSAFPYRNVGRPIRYVFKRGKSEERQVSLPDERKALAERYTIDAEEAEARAT